MAGGHLPSPGEPVWRSKPSESLSPSYSSVLLGAWTPPKVLRSGLPEAEAGLTEVGS